MVFPIKDPILPKEIYLSINEILIMFNLEVC